MGMKFKVRSNELETCKAKDFQYGRLYQLLDMKDVPTQDYYMTINDSKLLLFFSQNSNYPVAVRLSPEEHFIEVKEEVVITMTIQ